MDNARRRIDKTELLVVLLVALAMVGAIVAALGRRSSREHFVEECVSAGGMPNECSAMAERVFSGPVEVVVP